MKTIYCIEDINDLKYVGSTHSTLANRLSKHKTDKRLNRNTTSNKLHLEHSIIYELETCEDDISWERETHWMKKLNSVNQRRGQTSIKKDYRKVYYQRNREKIIQQSLHRYYSKVRPGD